MGKLLDWLNDLIDRWEDRLNKNWMKDYDDHSH